jgi:pyrimidine-nucleoside phosphorylase
MIYLGKKAPTIEEARSLAEQALYNGKALSLFVEFVVAQGGDSCVSEQPEEVLPKANKVIQVLSPITGYISRIHGEKVGLAAMKSGAGRETKESSIDPSAGVVLYKKCGDKVEVGQCLAEIHCDLKVDWNQAMNRLLEAYEFTPQPGVQSPLLGGIIQ